MRGDGTMKLKKAFLPLLALVLVLSLTVPSALAYFTDTTRVKGGYTIRQSTITSIDENFKNWTKTLTITNNEGAPVFVRARAFAGQTYSLTYSGSGWSKGEGDWWYYSSPLPEGTEASTLNVKIGGIPADDDLTEHTNFNVAVVYESTRVQYKEDGTPFADWSMILDSNLNGGEQP